MDALNNADAINQADRYGWTPLHYASLTGSAQRVAALLQAGVNVALGTDWIPSGSMNILRELQCARDYSDVLLASELSDHDLVGMVTWNAAYAARMDDAIGHLRPGLFADIAIFAIGWHLVFSS